MRTDEMLCVQGAHDTLATEVQRYRVAIVQIRAFALAMDESNWRDMKLHIERQCDVLAKAEGK